MTQAPQTKLLLMAGIAAFAVFIGYSVLNAPDRRTAGEKIGDAVDELQDRTPGERLSDAMKKD